MSDAAEAMVGPQAWGRLPTRMSELSSELHRRQSQIDVV